jgi:hypothetical protein
MVGWGARCPIHRDEAAMNGTKSEMRGFFAALRMTSIGANAGSLLRSE